MWCHVIDSLAKFSKKRAILNLSKGLFADWAKLYGPVLEHVIFFGPTGVGKTHLAQAIGHQACRLGYAVLFVKARKMFRALYKAK